MIDPDSIIVPKKNEENNIKLNYVPEFDFQVWDLEDDKELKKYFKTIEREVRGSYEYRAMIRYLRDNMNMSQCSFIKVSNEDNYNIKIEIHHYPFTLYDIVEIVYKKRCYYQESLNPMMVAKEIMMLHYKLLIGLIPLSTTVHQLVHDGKLFIPIQNVLGRYQLFIDFYKPFCSEEQLDTIFRIENYSINENSSVYNTEVLDNNNITIQSKDSNYQLPDFNNIQGAMNQRITEIKNNNYKLPTLEDKKFINKKDKLEDRKIIIKPFEFSRKE